MGLLLSFLVIYTRWSILDFVFGHGRVMLYDVSTIEVEDGGECEGIRERDGYEGGEPETRFRF